MKKRLMRILSMILVLALLTSMTAVFAYADETTDGAATEDAAFRLLINRAYDEGWSAKNGLSFTDRGSSLYIDSEVAEDYTYNYFMRFEVGSSDHSYAQIDLGRNKLIGTVMEFDMMMDDVCNMSGLMNFETPNRQSYSLLTIEDSNVYFYNLSHTLGEGGEYKGSATKPEEPDFLLGSDWMHVAFVWDFTYDSNPDDGQEETAFFKFNIYVGDTKEYAKTGELTLIRSFILGGKDAADKGSSFLRINSSGAPESDWGASICFDNLQVYTGANTYGAVTPDMGYGENVDINDAFTENIIRDVNAEKTPAQYLQEGLAMKVGVTNAAVAYKKQTLLNTYANDNGVPCAPVSKDGEVWLPLEAVLKYLEIPYYVHADGKYFDISSGLHSSYLSFGGTSATVDGKRVELVSPLMYVTDKSGVEFIGINMKDINTVLPGYYLEYDDMGLIVITECEQTVIDRNVSINNMLQVMKIFVFDYATEEEVVKDVELTTGFNHPYLYANQTKLDELRAVYLAKEGDDNYDPELKGYLDALVRSGLSAYKIYAYPSSINIVENDDGTTEEYWNYDYFVGIRSDDELREYVGDYNYINSYSLIQPYLNEQGVFSGAGDGYDPDGGRSAANNRATMLERMAIAYQITREVKYLQVMYEVAIRLGEWVHWGPGHFLNCADTTAPFALFFDWTFNAYQELSVTGYDYNGDGDLEDEFDIPADNGYYNTDKLAAILYEKGVYEGWLSTQRIYTSFPSHPTKVGSNGCMYTDRTNNWNAVCSSGMIIGSLAIIGYEQYREAASGVISGNIKTLTEVGLDIYAPEGAYIEGPGYWNYGTNNFFELCMVLDGACGTNYGLMDCWGIDKTCYFAAHTESNDGLYFNFHDGNLGGQDTSYFLYVASVFDDFVLDTSRRNQLKRGLKSPSLVDVIFYNNVITESSDSAISLDYYTESIDLYAARSSWDSGALFVSIIGGENKVSHGQIDAGSFVYHNLGQIWFTDLGTENYNCEGFWPEATRYRYYVMKPEGNNTIALTSDPALVPYGQTLQGGAHAIDYGYNEHGSYVVYEMSDTIANLGTWQRGVLLTNDRTTTVIQDELNFPNGVQTIYWFAHYMLQGSGSNRRIDKITLSADQKTAYLQKKINGEEKVIRVSIVTARTDLRFSIMDCYTFVHTNKDDKYGPVNENATYPKEYAMNAGSRVAENDRSGYGKLAIACSKTPGVQITVVIEEIPYDTMFNEAIQPEVGYEYTPFEQWEPVASKSNRPEVEEEVKNRDTVRKSNIKTHVSKIESFYKLDRAFNINLEDNYYRLTEIYYIASKFPGFGELAGYEAEMEAYNQYLSNYTVFYDAVNGEREKAGLIVKSFIGI